MPPLVFHIQKTIIFKISWFEALVSKEGEKFVLCHIPGAAYSRFAEFLSQCLQFPASKNIHQRLKHAPTKSSFNCSKCKKVFGSEVALRSHLKYVHTSQKKISCTRCDKTFKQIKNLRAHLASIHDIDQTKENYCEKESTANFKCSDCDSVFSYAKNLKAHRKSKHTGKKKIYECELCAVKFTEKKSLVRHIKAQHGN